MTRTEHKRLVADMIATFVRGGVPVKAARIYANGDILLLTQNPTAALDSPDSNTDWVDLAGTA
ncbi:hypothetical protein EON82_24730 [bacterium]|nr:MAG: hypothetical protein EON82_24730 [bacterium]